MSNTIALSISVKVWDTKESLSTEVMSLLVKTEKRSPSKHLRLEFGIALIPAQWGHADAILGH